jgi:excisionase family DNA binding protein
MRLYASVSDYRREPMESRPEGLELYDAKQVARILGLHLRTVQQFFKSGKIRGLKVGRTWKASMADIQAYLDAQRQAAMVVAGKEGL